MNKKVLFLITGIFLLSIPLVLAKDITLSIDQKEYYFLVGEEAVINLHLENTYKQPISGMLTYTITQSINQGNFQYSSSNTKSTSFSLEKEETKLPLSLGTSDSPMTMTLDLKFSYNIDEQREVNLNGIKIHFVSDQSQKKNKQNNMESSSQKSSQQPSSQQQDPFVQQERRMQQMIDQMFGNQQQQPQTAQQALQNNQMSQDSSVLKQQMQKQIQEQQKLNEGFQKQLAQNQDFQKEHQELLNQRYNVSNANFNPTSENSGNFEINYQNKNGQQASLLGEMKNGVITNLQKDTPEERQKLLDQLNKNEDFQKFQQQLEKQGFQQQNTEFSNKENKTIAKLIYRNENNETATIKAEFINKTIQEVSLEKEDSQRPYWWAFLLIVILLAISYIVYKKYFKKTKATSKSKTVVEEKPFDYISASKKMLEEAEELFKQKRHKDAYGRAGQALRLYLNFKYELKKELTNDEFIKYLKKHRKSYKEIKECFDLCSLVEFAKYEANNKDFNQIIEIARKNIK